MTQRVTLSLLVIILVAGHLAGLSGAQKNKEQKKEDPYADYVWPPPPNPPKIRLTDVIKGRVDVEARGGLKRAIIGGSLDSRFDELDKPFGVAFDSQGRLLVTESLIGAVIRFDPLGERMDVLGTTGARPLKTPLGIYVAPDDIIYVADPGNGQVLAYDPSGQIQGAYGQPGELQNPTDAELSPDGKLLYVCDSRQHRIMLFEVESGKLRDTLGETGNGPGQFRYPTSLTFDQEGNLFVVDQGNARVQLLDAGGEFIDQLGERGPGTGQFTRPKDVAVDDAGLIYVTDNAFNNVQIFDSDFTLLTFVGTGGQGPGQFHGASGIAVHQDSFAVVDQLGKRLQLFRYIGEKTAE